MSSKLKNVVKPTPQGAVAEVQIARYSGLLRVSESRLHDIAQAILPSSYTLSIVICGDTRMRTLNVHYRNKNTPANVLSFPLSHDSGEVFLNTARVSREAHRFGLSPEAHLQYLLIHGCLHLKGLTHGSTMDKAENEYRTRFGLRSK